MKWEVIYFGVIFVISCLKQDWRAVHPADWKYDEEIQKIKTSKMANAIQTENTETDFFKLTAHEHSQALFKLLMLLCIFYIVYHPFVQQPTVCACPLTMLLE